MFEWVVGSAVKSVACCVLYVGKYCACISLNGCIVVLIEMRMIIIFVLDRAICNRKLYQQVSSSELRSEFEHNDFVVQEFPTGVHVSPEEHMQFSRVKLRLGKMLLPKNKLR